MRAIGIDISDTSIELIEVKQRFGSLTVHSAARVELPSGIVEHGRYIDQEALIQKIEQAAADAKPQGIKLQSVYFAIPESRVFTHVFTFPKSLSKTEVDEALGLQFSDYFPYEMEDVAYDWNVVQSSEQTQMVLVGVCKKEYVQEIVDLAKKMNIRINGIDIESASCARAVVPQQQELEAHLMIDIGAHVTSVSVFDQNGLQSTIVLDVGGDAFTAAIAAAKNIPIEVAEKEKKNIHLHALDSSVATAPKEIHLQELYIAKLVTVVEEAKQCIQFFEGNHRKTVKGVYVCGGGALQPGIKDYFAQAFGIPVEIGNALLKLKSSDILKDTEQVLYANVIGLALGALQRKYHHMRFNFFKNS